MSFDMNKMLREAQRMQEELAKAQAEAAKEIVEASAGGGMVRSRPSAHSTRRKNAVPAPWYVATRRRS